MAGHTSLPIASLTFVLEDAPGVVAGYLFVSEAHFVSSRRATRTDRASSRITGRYTAPFEIRLHLHAMDLKLLREVTFEVAIRQAGSASAEKREHGMPTLP